MNNLIKKKENSVAWKPNGMNLKIDSGSGTIEYLLFTSFFTVPMIFDDDDDVKLEVDINTITEKKLQGSICHKIKIACEKVSKWQLEIPGNGRTKYEFINLFISIKRSGKQISAVISKKVVPYIKEYFLKGFTKIPMEEARKLDTLYQMKLLELNLRFKNCKNPVFTIDWLKSFFNITDEKYKRYSHLKEKVLESSFAGINTKTSFKYSYKEIKKGNKVVAIKLISGCDIKETNEKCEHDKEFEFASDCFNQLPSEEKDDLLIGSELFQDEEFKVLHAIEKFRTKYHEILKKYETVEEVLFAMKNLSIS